MGVVEMDQPQEAKLVESNSAETTTPKKKRGFAAMDPTLVSEIARKGGRAAHAAGTAHEFTSEKAREAGRLGGKASHAKRKAQLAGGGST
jgi:general stress protein YciG